MSILQQGKTKPCCGRYYKIYMYIFIYVLIFLQNVYINSLLHNNFKK